MLCTGSRGIALPFHDDGTGRRWGVSVTPRPLFTPGKDPVPVVQEARWIPGPVWTGAENLAPTGIRCLDRPASRQSLYRPSYRAYTVGCSNWINTLCKQEYTFAVLLVPRGQQAYDNINSIIHSLKEPFRVTQSPQAGPPFLAVVLPWILRSHYHLVQGLLLHVYIQFT